jgi:glutaredoxin
MEMSNLKKSSKGCCSSGTGCCSGIEPVQSNKKRVVIDFLYLDLSTCTWCQGTEKSLEDALDEVSNVLKASEIEVVLNKINVISEELAIKHKFISSPTIRVNGNDIQMDIKERKCESCGDLCGDSVDCRVWEFNGEEYTVPPKALIIEGILKSVFGGAGISNDCDEYELPENLKKFYTAIKEKSNNASCCGGDNTNKCCC